MRCGYHWGDCTDGMDIEMWGWYIGKRFFEKFTNVCGNCRKYLRGRFRYIKVKQ